VIPLDVATISPLQENNQERSKCPACGVGWILFRAGVKPLFGRTFLPEEELPGKDHEVVLSHRLWERRYGGDPQLLGRTIKIDGETSPSWE